MLPEMRGGVLNESNYSQVGKSLRQRVFKLKIVLGSKGLNFTNTSFEFKER